MRNLCFFIFSSFIVALTSAQLPQISLIQLATGYASPTDIKSCGDQRLFIVEQKGYIRILYKDGSKQATPFLNIDALVNNAQDEQGLLGLAFSPNYKQDGYFYVQYTTGPGVDSIRISRFSVMSNDSTQGDPNSEHVLLSFKDLEWNHNGGNLMFGPDGYLYISEGDGGSANDPNSTHGTGGNGQNMDVFFAKMLRIDVSNPNTNYSIPPSNPFVGVSNTKPEIWAYGLRNPWRCSFDKLTGDIWIGDVGQDRYEEIDFQAADSRGGENYGWRCREGFHVCPTSNTTGCAATGFAEPVAEIAHSPACSITGGYVYRGAQYSQLFGLYLFTDYCSGQFWSIKRTGLNTFDVDTLVVSPTLTYNLTSFGQDDRGELYVAWRGSATGTTGRIYRVAESTNCNPVAFISFSDTISQSAPLTLSALYGDTLSYQWYNSAGAINGATNYEYSPSQCGWYKVQVSKTLHSGCEAISDSVYVSALDTTALSLSTTPFSYCTNSSTVNINSLVSPLGGVFAGAGVSGTLFLPNVAGQGATDITYRLTNNLECTSTIHFPIQVLDTVSLFAISDLGFCADVSSVSLTGSVQPTGGIFVSAFVSNDSLFHANMAGVGAATVGYEFTDTGSTACVSRKSVEVYVNEKAVLTKNRADTVVCFEEPAFALDSFILPNGGTFIGNGVVGNVFDPTVALSGVHTITYQYINFLGCASLDSIQIEVRICGAINELKKNLSFNLFPNPSKGNFSVRVKANFAQRLDIVVTDAGGKICYRKAQLIDPTKSLIPLELTLAKGVYTVQLKGVEGSAVQNLVIE